MAITTVDGRLAVLTILDDMLQDLYDDQMQAKDDLLMAECDNDIFAREQRGFSLDL
jgi:hypothetical protein